VGIEKRLIILFWHLADRWGKVTPDGVRIEVPLSHGMIAKLVGSRRPTVTTAMGKLRDEGKILRPEEGAWILCGAPPEDLRSVRGGVGARDPRNLGSETPKDPGGE
jgi:DNA-binding transcriptional ArsR family regulator